MKQSTANHSSSQRKSVAVPSRTFYRPDSHCSELGAWYYLTEELGEVGPFDTREEAREALEMAQALDSCPQTGSRKSKKKRAIH